MRKLSIHELHSVGGGNTQTSPLNLAIDALMLHSELPARRVAADEVMLGMGVGLALTIVTLTAMRQAANG